MADERRNCRGGGAPGHRSVASSACGSAETTPDAALSLFDRFPDVRSVPWTRIADLPTPVEEHAWLAELVGATSVWVKRDDLSAARYGGNKVRKLEFLIGEALESGATDLITFGAAGSNHALATAVHGRAAGMAVHSVLMPQPNASYVARNLMASTAIGADLHYAQDRRSALATAARLRRRLHSEGRRCSIVPFGGTSPVSTLGFVNAGMELGSQIRSGTLPEPDLVFVPLGSMGTAAGLAIGMRATGLSGKVAAVPVLTDDARTSATLLQAIDEAQGLLRTVAPGFPQYEWSLADVVVVSGFLGEGYAVKTPEGAMAVDVMSRNGGIGLETTYTGKALAAAMATGASGDLRGKSVLVWDTYNSRDISDLVAAGDAMALPPELRRYVEGDSR